VRWGKFKVGNLFDIRPTKNYGLTNPELFATSGKTPVIVNSSRNNGVGGLVDLKATEKGGIITFSDTTTSESIFYQPNDFIGYSHVQGVYPIEPTKWSKNSLLYFVTTFRKITDGKFNYGTKFNRKIAVEFQIELPVNDKGEIDFKYMESYISQIERRHIIKLEKHLIATDLINYELNKEDKEALSFVPKWEEFRLSDVFGWQKQKEIDPLLLNKLKVSEEKSYPFYGQATLNKGIITYCELKNEVLNNADGKPTILIHSNNQNTVYLETPFYLKDGHGATSVLQAEFLNKLNALYIITSIKKVISKRFSYNAKATKVGLKNTIVRLPVTSEGELDILYMEAYIKAQQKLAISNMVQKLDLKIATTKLKYAEKDV